MGILRTVRRGAARLLGRRPAFRDLTPDERERFAAEWAERHLADLRALAERWGVDPAVLDRPPPAFLVRDEAAQDHRAGRLAPGRRPAIPPAHEEEDAQQHRHG